jgi:hypothetical protein
LPGGSRLSPGQVQQLQWVLPSAFSADLVAAFLDTALAGTKLRFVHQEAEHWWAGFDCERMLEELLGPTPHTPLTRDVLLPIAGCGRQRTLLYLVNVCDLAVWSAEAGMAPKPLGLGLSEVLRLALPEPRARARRRLPPKQRCPRVVKARTRPRLAQVSTPCPRTLTLFG